MKLYYSKLGFNIFFCTLQFRNMYNYNKLYYKTLTIILLTVFSFCSFSKDITTEKSIKTSFNDAEWYFMEGDYSNARTLYAELVKIDKNNSNYNYKLAVTILFDNQNVDDDILEKYLAIAVKNTNINYKSNYKETSAPIDAFVFYGDVLRYKYEFDEAIKSYENYLALLNGKKGEFSDYVNREINNCNTAKKLSKNNNITKDVELGPKIVNNKKSKSFPLVSIDQTVSIFAYGENNVTFGNINYEQDDENYKTDDFYFSKKVNGVWQEPINITKDLKIKHQAFPVSMSADGETLFLVQDDNDDGNIYVSHYINEKWTPIKKLNKNINSKLWETHASVTPDGKTLYFTSERKGGFGGFDIYYSTLDENGKWGKPINLGDKINTKYDEDLPFIGADNTQLYFCSQGHENIGGYDIFKAEIINGEFQKAENVGFVLNSPRNDLFYVASQGNKFTFSKLAKDESVIVTEAPKTIAVTGKIKTNNNLPNTFKIKTDSLITDLQLNTNTFTFNAQKQNISFVVTADGFSDKKVNIDLSNYNENTKELIVELKPIAIVADNNNSDNNNNSTTNNVIPNKPITNNSISEFVLFDFNSSIIKNEYKKYLNIIAQNSHDKTIEVYAYADEKGSEEYNKKLSRKRAISVKKYLINKGISDEKIVVVPKGETTKFKTDSLNRRAEIKFSNTINATDNNNKIILFEFDKYRLSTKAKLIIDDIIAKITSENTITIIAFTDPKGGITYNNYLSIQRANSVRKYLISKGLPKNKINAQGKGILQSNTEDYLKRKAEIIIK